MKDHNVPKVVEFCYLGTKITNDRQRYTLKQTGTCKERFYEERKSISRKSIIFRIISHIYQRIKNKLRLIFSIL